MCEVCKFRSILVLDDDHIQLELTGLLLQAAGLLAHPFTNASTAMEWLAQRKTSEPVTVLMDLHIPDSVPTALIAALRAAVSDLRIVGMSASQPSDDALAALDTFLPKPLRSASLERSLCACKDTAAAAAKVSASRSKRAAPALNETIFNRFAAMLPSRALASLYSTYFFDAEQRLQSIAEAAIACNAEKFQHSLHALKGSSAMLGLTRVVQRAVVMEQLTSATILQHGLENLAYLRQDVERAQSAVQLRLQTMPAFVPPDSLPDALPTHVALTES